MEVKQTLDIEGASSSLQTQVTTVLIQHDGNQFENLVDFNHEDPENPFNWSSRHRSMIITPISLTELLTMLGTIMCAPNAPQILDDFHSIALSIRHCLCLFGSWEK
ncbi:hypothetical protein OCU04_002501 [Sclerotinia nivalis]|uniref:Uncharacterized protein n=1 Tax=Sclerotinia nivalis TaxID=352851 RepID=A0A9X0DMM9_9HELO|nr:hypothetical protein OCU04_002501 [Sclerotinia nivalis]